MRDVMLKKEWSMCRIAEDAALMISLWMLSNNLILPPENF